MDKLNQPLCTLFLPAWLQRLQHAGTFPTVLMKIGHHNQEINVDIGRRGVNAREVTSERSKVLLPERRSRIPANCPLPDGYPLRQEAVSVELGCHTCQNGRDKFVLISFSPQKQHGFQSEPSHPPVRLLLSISGRYIRSGSASGQTACGFFKCI